MTNLEIAQKWKVSSVVVDGIIADAVGEYTKNQMLALAFGQLRDLMGFVENGSSDVVTVFQDDATKTYNVRIGAYGPRAGKYYHGSSLIEAIGKAHRDNPPD